MIVKGIVTRASRYTVKETIDLLQTVLVERGITVYARIDQGSEVNSTGQNLSPLEFILFGNPKSGGSFMIENPLVALDLPLKVIAWEDHEKKVWLAYNDAAYLEERYSLSHRPNSPLQLDALIDIVLNK